MEFVCNFSSAQNSIGEILVFCGGYDRFAISFVSGGSAGHLFAATTPDTRIAVDTEDPSTDSDFVDLNKTHQFCVVFGESNSLDGWSIWHNGKQQPIFNRGGNLSIQSDGTGSIVGRTNDVSSPDNANGSLYAFRVYDRALTTQEIAHNYACDKYRFNIQ